MNPSESKTLSRSSESGADSTLDPITRPERLSQTFLAKCDSCMRSGYLYLKYRGQERAHNLDFGTAFHLFAERAMLDLIQNGEKTLYAAAEGEDPVSAAVEVAAMSAAIVNEVLREHPELQVTKHGADALRALAYHWSVAQPTDPETVVAVERKFVLDLDSGWTVSGKVDLVALEAPDTFGIIDLKTQFPPPADESEAESFFQLRMYSLLVLYGQPVEDVDGEEVRLSPIGDGINYVRPRLVYPRVLRQDGELHRRPETGVLTRAQVADFRTDVERDAEKISRALETGEWPAVPGSHCSMCPCPAECPLPEQLRGHAGTVTTVEEAADALSWADREGAEVAAKKREARRFVEMNGPVRWGADKVTELDTSESWKTDWAGLEEAVHAAVAYGEPFDLALYRTRTVSTRMKTRTLTGPELDEPESLDEKYGEDAPW